MNRPLRGPPALLVLATAMAGVSAMGQTTPPDISPLDGTTPAINTPGNPAAAYSLSSIEHLNFANGHLSFSLPLAELMGRGNAKETMVLPIESNWRVENQNYTYSPDGQTFYYGTAYLPINEVWAADGPTHWSGAMIQRSLGDTCSPAQGEPNNEVWINTLLRLTFKAPDGTEYEFRDAQTGGLKEGVLTGANNLNSGYNRGTIFQAWDGSGATYTASTGLTDQPRAGCYSTGSGGSPTGNGVLQLRDGTSYTVTAGYVAKIEDRNGNTLTLPAPNGGTVTITDGLGRQVTDSLTSNGETITYPVAGGAQETVTITYNTQGNLLMQTDPAGHNLTGLNTLQTLEQLFPTIDWNCNTNVPSCPNPSNGSTLWDPNGLVQSVSYPNGQSYQFLYNSFGDVAEVILPTCGAYRYFYNLQTLEVGNSAPSTGSGYVIERTLAEKDVYTNQNDTAPSQVIKYSSITNSNGTTGQSGHVVYSDGSIEDHYSFAINPYPPLDGTAYKFWQEGKELQTNYTDTNGTTLLLADYSNWQQMAYPNGAWWTNPALNPGCPNSCAQTPEYNPRVIDKTTTIGTQQSEQDFTYDQYNNQTEEDEYDFGTGSHGSALIRATTTSYQYYTNPPPGAYIVDLPLQRLVCTAIGAGCTTGSATARTNYTYDGTTYVPIATGESSIGNHDAAYTTGGANNLTRGNATTIAQYLTGTPLNSNYSYDIAGNIVTTWDPRTVVHSYGYTDAGTLTTGVTFALPTSVTSYTAISGSSTAIPTTGTALTSTVQYDYNLGKPTQTTDVNGNATSYSYTGEPLGRLLKVTRAADNGTTTFTYNDVPSSEPSSELPGLVNVETASDQASSGDGKMKSVVFYDGLGREWESSKRAASQNIMVCKTYDVRSRLYTQSNPAFSSVTFGTGSANTDTSICGINAPIGATSYGYDGLSRPIKVTDPDGSLTSYLYQADTASHTNQTLEIEPGATGQQPNRLHYADAAGRLKELDENVTSWQSGSYGFSGQSTYKTTYGYDVLDDLLSVAQSNEPRSFLYDSLKRLTQAANPESGTIIYTYDPSNNLSTRTDANGSVLTFSAYDGMNRVTGKSYSLGTLANVQPTSTVSYAYGDTQTSCNLKGRLMSVSAGSLVTNYSCYEWAGKPTSSSQVTSGTTYSMPSYAYDLALEPISFTFPSLRVQTTQYDTGGRVASATGTYNALPTTYAGSFGYFPDGTLANVSLGPSAQVQQYCQNNRLQTIGVRLGAAAQTNCANSSDLLNLAMAYGSAGANDGNLTKETLVAPLNSIADTFTYDAYNRIINATEGTAPAWTQTYNYDAYGNRWVTSPGGFSLYQFTPTGLANFNTKNQVVIQGSTYDNAGNQTVIGGYTFTYDAENRLYSSAIGNSTTSYTYDGEGRRVIKATTGGTTTVYVCDADGEVAAEYSNTPPPKVGTLYLTADHLGSTRLETNELGAAVAYHDYLPFGEEIPSPLGGRGSLYGAADGLTHKFTKKERDIETGGSATQGMDYFGARYFSGTQGRFTSPDESKGGTMEPLTGNDAGINTALPYADSSDPQTLNKYAYVRNNPLRYADPTGHCPPCVVEVLESPVVLKAIEDVAPYVSAMVGGIAGYIAGTAIGNNSAGVLPGFPMTTMPANVMAAQNQQGGHGADTDKPPSGPKAADAPGVTAGGQATDKHGNKLGPSGDEQINKTKSNTREDARNKALNEGSGATEHSNPKDGQPPHFHPADAKGVKKPNSTHHQYPE
jgi:RHS repeat-associated protein